MSFLTAIDKTNGNVAFQHVYALILVKELVLDQIAITKHKTCIQVYIYIYIYIYILSKTNDQVISDHTTFLKNKFDLKVDEESKILPNIY